MNGSGNWTRTSDPRINSPLLYQLSYAGKMASSTGFEPVTFGLGIRCSIQLSYEEPP